jgi:hypothetical protein
VRFVYLLVGLILLGLAGGQVWNWYASEFYPESIAGTQRQMCVMVGCLILLGCAFSAAGIGSWKHAGLEGFCLGLVGGPMGLIAAFLPDNRPECPQCGGRLDATARICHRCQARISAPQRNTKATLDSQKNRNAEADRRHADSIVKRTRKSK